MPVKINPIYSSWYWEAELWGRVMDGGGGRNPMTLGPVEVPQLMESWIQGTWVDPSDGITKASVTVTMKPDSKWSDGLPVTIDDFIYTLAILPGELRDKGCSDAWWQPTLDQVAGYYKLDDYSAQILMRSNTYLATTWIVGNVILPKHFWQPFVAANPALTIMGDLGTGLIGTGPFLYTALVAGTSATLVRNPTYYNRWPDDITLTFISQDGSVQLTPNKIRPNSNGFGTGELLVRMTTTNQQKFYTESFSHVVTIQKVAPGTPGPVVEIHNDVHPALAAGAVLVEDIPQSLAKGEYEIVVTKTITSPDWEEFFNPIIRIERVKITVAGDLNGDWKVNILDITPIAIRFGAVRGDAGSPPLPKYDAVADLNRDGKINILDIVQVALVFGWDP
jgi:ABC-type transport system substrate-binding protein